MGKSSPHQSFENHHAVDAKSSGVSVSQMLAAGMASVGAAVVTSRFGVAGTIIGAALTTMIITGGSAIIKSYLETIAGHAKSMPQKINTGRTRLNRSRAGRGASVGRTTTVERDVPNSPPGMAVYGRSERQGFAGRFKSAFSWFSQLSPSRKRGVLFGAAVPAVVAFVIAMSAITGVELVSGKTLSCLTASDCQQTTSTNGSGSNTTFGALASATRPSNESEQPFSEQLAPPNLSPDQQNGQSDNSGGGSGFFGQPSDNGSSGTDSGVPSGSSGSGAEEVPSGVEPVTPTEEDPSQAIPETPTNSGGAVPSESAEPAQPSEVQ